MERVDRGGNDASARQFWPAKSDPLALQPPGEVERIRRGDPRDDADLLDPNEDEDAPEHVEQLDRDEQRSQRDARVAALRGEAHAIVADEHYGLAGAGAAVTLVVNTPGA